MVGSADLNPRRGSEPATVRPVVVVQSDLLNETDHPRTWILPCTTSLSGENILRVELPARMAGNARDCEVMIDQSRAADRRRLLRPLAAHCYPRGFRKVAPPRRPIVNPRRIAIYWNFPGGARGMLFSQTLR